MKTARDGAGAESRPPFPEHHQESPAHESDVDPPPRYAAEHHRPAEGAGG
jgi:hypothetical protein